MIRFYTDKTGAFRRLKYLKGGEFSHWHKDHSACWTTWWLDLDDGSEIRIPNAAWEKLQIKFVDKEEVSESSEAHS